MAIEEMAEEKFDARAVKLGDLPSTVGSKLTLVADALARLEDPQVKTAALKALEEVRGLMEQLRDCWNLNRPKAES